MRYTVAASAVLVLHMLGRANAHGIEDPGDILATDPPVSVSESLPPTLPTGLKDPAKAVIETLKAWPSGSTIKVCFQQADQRSLRAIADTANEWTKWASIKFDFGADSTHICASNPNNFDIKIGFRDAGYWSYVGIDSRKVSISMNLQNMDSLSDSISQDQKRLILHEFGHALGLQHEHQSPDARCDEEISWEAAKSFYAQCCGWSSADVEQNLKTLTSTPRLRVTAYDPKSIMHYAFPAVIFKNGRQSRCYTHENYKLSDMDKAAISQLYPDSSERQAKSKRQLAAGLADRLRQGGASPEDTDAVSRLTSQIITQTIGGNVEQKIIGDCGSNIANASGVTINSSCSR